MICHLFLLAKSSFSSQSPLHISGSWISNCCCWTHMNNPRFLDGQLLMNAILFQYFLNSNISPRCSNIPSLWPCKNPYIPLQTPPYPHYFSMFYIFWLLSMPFLLPMFYRLLDPRPCRVWPHPQQTPEAEGGTGPQRVLLWWSLQGDSEATISGWWLKPTPLKKIRVRQLGWWLFPTEWKNTICVSNHQPDLDETKQNIPSGVIKHGLWENGSFIGDFPIQTSVHRRFSIAIFDYRRVINSLDMLGDIGI